MEESDAEPNPSRLRQTIEQYQVSYQVWPDWAIVDGRKVQVGFELELCAKAAKPKGGSGGPATEVYDELRRIAAFVLPHDPNDAEFDILPFDNSLHENPRRGFRPEIVLALQILHRHGFDPVDDREECCLSQIESGLRELGLTRAR